jgi:peptide/nickel transport system substrate-binding protein
VKTRQPPGRSPEEAEMRKMSAVTAVALAITLPLLGFARAAPAPSTGRPVFGGTLRLIAANGPDHIDTVPAYYTADYILERAYARQLVSYPAVPDRTASSPGWKADTTPVADAATQVPTVANGGITDAGTTYTFHIKPDVDWNTAPARQVVAQDFLREFKAFCNPAPGGFVGNLRYFTVTIKGMRAYCAKEIAYFAKHRVTAANVTAFQNSHSISGITTPNSSTIRFHLIGRTPDFIYILTLPFASARPVEYDRYLPNSLALDRHTISDGPYQITSFRPGQSIVLQKNPAWRQDTDPLRHQYVNTITVTIGGTGNPITDLKRNIYDLTEDLQLQPSDIRRLSSNRDFHIWPGANLLPYVVFNLRSPNSRHAIGRLDVRRAVEYGIDKAAIARLLGGPAVASVLNSVIPAGNGGHLSKNPYPSAGGRGSATKCRAQLAKAGFRHGLKLRYMYADDTTNTEVFKAIRASLDRCGIKLIGVPEPGSTFFVDLGNAPANNRPGTWDLGQPGWIPDWYGNNGRSIIDPLFHTNCVVNTNNYGCYDSRLVDRLIAAAESARSAKAAAAFWLRADRQIMKDAAIVPLVAGQSPIFSSPEAHEAGVAHGVVFLPNIGGPDITNIWIKR